MIKIKIRLLTTWQITSNPKPDYDQLYPSLDRWFVNGSEEPDPYKNLTDPKFWFIVFTQRLLANHTVTTNINMRLSNLKLNRKFEG
jgi:hypothetical protein